MTEPERWPDGRPVTVEDLEPSDFGRTRGDKFWMFFGILGALFYGAITVFSFATGHYSRGVIDLAVSTFCGWRAWQAWRR